MITSGDAKAATRAVELEGVVEQAGCSREDNDISLRPFMFYADAVIDRRPVIFETVQNRTEGSRSKVGVEVEQKKAEVRFAFRQSRTTQDHTPSRHVSPPWPASQSS